jgi:hypothetical protein
MTGTSRPRQAQKPPTESSRAEGGLPVTPLKVAQFLAILLTALVMGVLWGTWLSLARTMTDYDATTFLADGQHMIDNLAGIMPVLMVAAAVVTLASLVLLPRPWPLLPAVLTGLTLLLLIAVILVTVLVEVPIDNKVSGWTVATLPADWEDIRAHWSAFHTLRTFLSVGAVATMAGAALTLPSRGRPRR